MRIRRRAKEDKGKKIKSWVDNLIWIYNVGWRQVSLSALYIEYNQYF